MRKYTKRPQNISNGRKMYQITIKYLITTFTISGPSINTQIGIFGMQIYHLAALICKVKSCTFDHSAVLRKKGLNPHPFRYDFRVTRLGELSPIGRFFTLGSFGGKSQKKLDFWGFLQEKKVMY
jgi:hypothetical protein